MNRTQSLIAFSIAAVAVAGISLAIAQLRPPITRDLSKAGGILPPAFPTVIAYSNGILHSTNAKVAARGAAKLLPTPTRINPAEVLTKPIVQCFLDAKLAMPTELYLVMPGLRVGLAPAAGQTYAFTQRCPNKCDACEDPNVKDACLKDKLSTKDFKARCKLPVLPCVGGANVSSLAATPSCDTNCQGKPHQCCTGAPPPARTISCGRTQVDVFPTP